MNQGKAYANAKEEHLSHARGETVMWGDRSWGLHMAPLRGANFLLAPLSPTVSPWVARLGLSSGMCGVRLRKKRETAPWKLPWGPR